MYDIDGRIAISSTYGCDVYAKAKEKLSFKKYHMKMLSSLHLVCKQYTIFDDVEFQRRYRENPFALGDTYLTPLYQHVQ